MPEVVRSADGTEIAYERAGVGPALILVGGAMSTRQSAGQLLPLLTDAFTVYAFDRRGRGDSGDTAPYAPEREVEDLRTLIDVAGGSAFVYGHSSGGILSLNTAAAGAAIPRLAVYEPPYVDNHDLPEHADMPAMVRAAVGAGDRDGAVEAFIRGTGSPFDPAIKQSPWWPGMTAVAHTLPYDLAITGDGHLPVERLGKITGETLGIYGGASPAWAEKAIDQVIAAIPNASKQVAQGQTHAAAPEVTAPIIIEFFS